MQSQPHRAVYKSTSKLETPLYTGQPAGTSGVHHREVPLYTGQPAGSQWCPLLRGSTVYRTASWVPMVSSIERFHCIQDSQLGPNGVHYGFTVIHGCGFIGNLRLEFA